MPDIRTLLRDAAPTPAAPLRMDVVRARARRSSTRRLVAWITGLGMLIGVGVPVGTGLLPSAGEGDSVTIVDPRPTIETVPTTQQPAVTVPTDRSGSFATPPTGDPGRGTLPDPLAPATQPTPTSTSPPTTAGAGYPPAAACWVDTSGLGQGETRACRYTATGRGGWNSYSSTLTPSLDKMPLVRVTVTRGGDVMTYRSEHVDEHGETQYENCAAGDGWGCTTRGRP